MEPRARHRLRPLALLPAAAVLVSACKLYLPGTEDSEGDTGVRFLIAPTPHAAVRDLELPVEAVELERSDGEEHRIDFEAPVTVSFAADLDAGFLDTEVFASESLPVGEYRRLTLRVDADAVFFVPADTGQAEALVLPGDGRLNYESEFQLEAGDDETLVLQPDLHSGLSFDGNEFSLGTSHIITTTARSGGLSFLDLPACPEPGVYLFEGFDQDPVDLGDGDGPFFSLWLEEAGTSLADVRYVPSGKYSVIPACNVGTENLGSGDGTEFREDDAVNVEVEDEMCITVEFGSGAGSAEQC